MSAPSSRRALAWCCGSVSPAASGTRSSCGRTSASRRGSFPASWPNRRPFRRPPGGQPYAQDVASVDGYDRIFDLVVGDLVPWLAAFGAMLVLTGLRYPAIALAFVVWVVFAVLIQQWGSRTICGPSATPPWPKGSEIGGITSDILANAVTVKSSAERREQEGFGRQLASYTRLQFARWHASDNIFVGVRVLGVAVEGVVLFLFARA